MKDNQSKKVPHGSMHHDALFLRQGVGEATDNDGREYELSTSMSVQPMIHNPKTKNTYILTWDAMLRLAKAAGIDKEFADVEEIE